MLIIKRKAQDVITIAPTDEFDMNRPVRELFADGVIEIKLLEVGRRQVKIAIDAPKDLQIWRGYRNPDPGTLPGTDGDTCAEVP